MTKYHVGERLYSFDDLHYNAQGFPQLTKKDTNLTPADVYFRVRESATSKLERTMCSFFFRRVNATAAYCDGNLGDVVNSAPVEYVAGKLVACPKIPLFFQLGLRDLKPVLRAIYMEESDSHARNSWFLEASQARQGLVYVHRVDCPKAKKTLDCQSARIERLLGIGMTRTLLGDCKVRSD